MNWKNLGMIFRPAEHGFSEFAQSPQALDLGDRLRVYFSTRTRDETGKFLSHVAYADLDRDLKVQAVSNHTVIPLGELGCFDEHGIFPVSPLRAGDRILAYTTGWNRKVSVSVDAAIGLAESRDGGKTFEKPGPGPVMAASLGEPFLVGDAFVRVYGGLFHMWYIYGTCWIHDEIPERIYKIAHATSTDGATWKRDGRPIIPDVLENECQALPTVLTMEGRHHMALCFRHATNFRKNPGRGYRLGWAVSEDLEHWMRDDRSMVLEESADGWNRDMKCYPHLVEWAGRTLLLYNGNEFGKHGFGAAALER